MRQRGGTKLWFVVVLLALAALLAGCGASAKAGAASGDVVLDREDLGQKVVLQKEQNLVITLDANPSTGYRWDVVDAASQVLALVGEPEFQSEAEAQADVVGASGVQILRFEAKESGTTKLTLVYHRPWETEVEPLEALTVEVEVN
ncbi:MAG: protease inhibitor I42 family protein [Anaerolineae bacterium]|jgi:inhibitor of cysteine peptidase